MFNFYNHTIRGSIDHIHIFLVSFLRSFDENLNILFRLMCLTFSLHPLILLQILYTVLIVVALW